MKPACRIAQKYIDIPRSRRIYRIEDHTGRIGTLAAADHIHPGTVCPLAKLLTGRRAEGIRRRDQYPPSLPFQFPGQLAYSGGLTHAVNADHQYDGLLFLEGIRSLLHLHLLLDILDQEGFAVGRLLDMVLLHLLPQPLQDRFGGLHPDIPHDQNLFQFFIEILVYVGKTVKYGIYPMDDVVPRLRQSFF